MRGRTLGFPTANVSIDERCIAPPDGVYAGYVYLEAGRIQPSAVSVGRRPTFYADRGLRLLEAHLLDFDEDLYGRVITVELVTRLRDQIKFDDAEQLRSQLVTDTSRAHDVLSAIAPSCART